MRDISIENIRFDQVVVQDAAEYNGFHIRFMVENQRFDFLVGGKQSPFPLNIRHQFNEKEICHICGSKIYPVPIGHQVCKVFQENKAQLLRYFQKRFPSSFLVS
ncbi:hypothetical protein [Sediminibacillus massiliensis]|uniref:hypothetical protein n=1 Tax=Sediminibacillus massiliensis TaxID=1926277 RepID=UPI0009883D4A|nr:hypothetical protein [Sediminibacillus massiliensis]